MKAIDEVANQYHRLVLLVAPAGGGKTAVLQDVHKRKKVPLFNINLELSQHMLNLSQNERVLELPCFLEKKIADSASEVVLMDNIEILFDVSLGHDPLRLLQRLARNKTVVAAWNGKLETEEHGLRAELSTPDSFLITYHPSIYLFYATPDHLEYRRYPVKDFWVVVIPTVA